MTPTTNTRDEKTYVSQLTSKSPSAIAVLTVEGPQALELARQSWRPNAGSDSLAINAIRYGFMQNEHTGRGESVVVCRTAENRIELHCHGGQLAAETIVRLLVSLGAVKRTSFQHESCMGEDPSISEAREDLTLAATQRTTAILLDQYRGALKSEFEAIQSMLNEGNLSGAKERLRQLSDRTQLGSHLIEPWRVVLAGPPNVGKSSLLNLLLGYTRAIVHEQAGTTRDLLSERSSFDGWPIELIDSAGIRSATGDAIEATGIQQSLERVATADCTLLLVDRLSGWTDTHNEILARCSDRVIVVVTKSDLVDKRETQDHLSVPFHRRLTHQVDTSSLTGQGFKELMQSVIASLVPIAPNAGDAVPFRKRHREKIASMMQSLSLD